MTTVPSPLAPLPHRRRTAVSPVDASPVAAGAAPRSVPLGRVSAAALLAVGAVAGGLLVAGRPWQDALLPGFALLLAAYGAVFCLRAVTVTGFLAGSAGAGLVIAGSIPLLGALAVAGVLAVACGGAPEWRRVEAWQSDRARMGDSAPGPVGRLWRWDRVAAAFLVLSFPPAMAAFAEFFIAWSTSR